jgi:predicted nuclease with TOPRIM domain
MINTLRIYDELKETMESGAARKITDIITLIYEDLQNTVTKKEFNELTDVVKDLADAQKRTEIKVEELAEAQKRTEKKIEELANAQKKLTEAQARSEKELKNLARQVGGLSDRLGGSLEDLSYDVLPACLEKYHQIEVDSLGRESFIHNGREIEFNVYGKGIEKTTGKKLIIIGEVKTNITLKEVKDFIRVVNMARESIGEEIFPLLFGFRIRLDARELAKANNIRMFVSYGKEIM